jgi:hypothetical protein
MGCTLPVLRSACSTDEDSEASSVPAAPATTSNGDGAGNAEKRTIVSQDSTGPREQWRRWGRTFSAPMLTLGDVRSLIARVAWSYGQNVYSISAAPLV